MLIITHCPDFLTHECIKNHSVKSLGMWEKYFHRNESPESVVSSTCVWILSALTNTPSWWDWIISKASICLNLSSRIFYLHTGDFSSSGTQKKQHVFFFFPLCSTNCPQVPCVPLTLYPRVSKVLRHCQRLSPGDSVQTHHRSQQPWNLEMSVPRVYLP